MLAVDGAGRGRVGGLNLGLCRANIVADELLMAFTARSSLGRRKRRLAHAAGVGEKHRR